MRASVDEESSAAFDSGNGRSVFQSSKIASSRAGTKQAHLDDVGAAFDGKDGRTPRHPLRSVPPAVLCAAHDVGVEERCEALRLQSG